MCNKGPLNNLQVIRVTLTTNKMVIMSNATKETVTLALHELALLLLQGDGEGLSEFLREYFTSIMNLVQVGKFRT